MEKVEVRMKISARNVWKGNVISIERGAVNAVVKVDVQGLIVTSVITINAVEELGLEVGKEGYVVVKASNVMLGVDHE